MTSQAQILSNRRNAGRSSGPRSAAGKQRAARNALKHGLAIPVALHPAANAAAERLAQLIAGPNAGSRLLEAARRLAEAEIDIIRVRDARTHLYQTAIADQYRYPQRKTLFLLRQLWTQFEQTRSVLASDAILRVVDPIPLSEISEIKRLGIRVDEAAREISRLDRYEQRAMSRRNSALREFESIEAGAGQTG